MTRLLLLLALLTACAPVSPPASPVIAPRSDPYDECWSAEPAPDCVGRVEAQLIASAGLRVERIGAELHLASRDGRGVTLVNDTTEGDRYLRHLYHRWVPELDAHLVRIGFHEGSAYLLVHGTSGERSHLQAEPVVSPDGARFATASVDLEAGYDPNGVQIWEADEGGFQLLWAIGSERWGASDITWRSHDALTFTRHQLQPDGQTERTWMRLTFDDQEVRLSRMP